MSIFESAAIQTWVSSPYALFIISLFSFSESAFFIIPPEVLLIPMGLLNPSRAIPLAILVSITSVAGAVFGYFLGAKGGKPILHRLFAEEKIEKVRHLYQKYGASAVAVAAFTPIPYKVFTLTAGTFDINFKKFLLVSIIARSARYLIIGGLIFFFGDSIRYFLEHQLDKFLLVATVMGISAFAIYKFLYPKLEERFTSFTLRDRIRSFFHLPQD